ncbi:HalOD1 output domain-containing protein [Halopelagius fulvigenes]|uniref:HalOD1 output domain-containing protein n=1 Tax=Halopelagius fulvigenes TaxID=1198324 RepID=A0ABD5U1Q6_9EURY
MRADENEIHRNLDTDANPTAQVVQAVADQKGMDPMSLQSAWNAIGQVLDPLFSTPPSPDADVEITFNYEGYRITVGQDGCATFDELE